MGCDRNERYACRQRKEDNKDGAVQAEDKRKGNQTIRTRHFEEC